MSNKQFPRGKVLGISALSLGKRYFSAVKRRYLKLPKIDVEDQSMSNMLLKPSDSPHSLTN